MEEAARNSRWSLSRIEIRTSLDRRQWPVARVELDHDERGRLTDIAVGRGAMASVFNALAQLFGVAAKVETLKLDYRADPAGDVATVSVELMLRIEGRLYPGRAAADDILLACASAFVDALEQVDGAEPAETIWS